MKRLLDSLVQFIRLSKEQKQWQPLYLQRLMKIVRQLNSHVNQPASQMKTRKLQRL
ncbi:hypothetical protein Mapa_004085 [Marchantia paleacea]|nr:hypothetical protein Mapa_004085 [Marchantia paleacea]